MEEVKQALLTIKKECSSNEDCNKCQVKKILGDCVQSFYVPTPENWIPENWIPENWIPENWTTQRR